MSPAQATDLLRAAVFQISLISAADRNLPTRWHCGKASTFRLAVSLSRHASLLFPASLTFDLSFSLSSAFPFPSLLVERSVVLVLLRTDSGVRAALPGDAGSSLQTHRENHSG
jgi:hypothetical protein